MVCSIHYTPLCGLGPDDPVCGLLEVDGATLLIDCGWDENFTEGLLDRVVSVVPRLDGVLLSHHSLNHIGALPYLVARAGLNCPIYATLPVHRMGQLALMEAYQSHQEAGDFSAFTPGDIAVAFDPARWCLTRFFQRTHILGGLGDGPGVSVTPHGAGRLVGGAVWRVVGNASGEEVVYATDWGHKREIHLSGCLLGDLATRPAALLCDATPALAPGVAVDARNSELQDLLIATLRGADGCVLVPVDGAGRALEVALALDELWAREKFDRVYPLVWVGGVARAVAEAARSQLEWMSDSVGKAFGMRRDNPFNFRCLRVLSSARQLAQLPVGAKVVLASHFSLGWGPARTLFAQWAGDERNSVVLVQRGPAGSLSDQLLRHVPGPDPLALTLTLSKRVPLEGAELEAWEAGQQLGAGAEAAPEASVEGQGRAEEAGGAVGGVLSPRGGGGGQVGVGGSLLPSAVAGAGTGLLPLRSNTPSISTLVKDVSGVLVQTITPSRSLPVHPAPHPHPHPLGEAAGVVVVKTEPGAGAAGALVPVPLTSASQGTHALADVLMEGFEPPQGAAGPMFPDEDDLYCPGPEEWDEYGAKLAPGEFSQAGLGLPLLGSPLKGGDRGGAGGRRGRQREKRETKSEVKGQKMDSNIKDEEDDDYDRRLGGGESGEEEEESGPTKVVTEEVQVEVKAAVRYFNFEGLTDAKYLTKAVADMAPRALVVLRGAPEAREQLGGVAQRELAGLGARVELPAEGETVDLSTPDVHSLYVSGALAASAVPRKLGASGYKVALVDAVVAPPNPHFPHLLQLLPASKHGATDGMSGDVEMEDVEVLAGEGDAGGQGQWLGDVFFSDAADGVKLSDVKKALADAGISSTFVGTACLHLAGPSGPIPVTITKASAAGMDAGGEEDKGHLVVEAAMCEAYEELLQKVRSVLYTQYSVAA